MNRFVPRIGFSTNVFDNPADIVATTREILDHFTDIEVELEDEAKSAVFDSSQAEYEDLVGRLRSLLTAANRQISVHAPYLSRTTDLASCDDNMRREAIRQATQSIRFCADIGGDRLTYHPGFIGKNDHKAALTENLKRSIEELQHNADARAVRLCLENMGSGRPKYLVYSPEEHLDLHRQTGTWMTLDLVHLATWCTSVEEMDEQMALYAPITANIHINDMPAGKHRHIPLGRGVLPISHMLCKMHELGYRGAAIIDEFARPAPAGDYLHCTKQFVLSAQQ
jgi:sugar phosphate isomerase/epimerase